MAARKKAHPDETASRGFEIEGNDGKVSVRVTVDFAALALQLVGRARKSKSGKARGCKGAVTVAVLRPDDVWPFPRPTAAPAA